MHLNLDDTGGARELAFHRLKTAKEDLEAAQLNFANGQYRASNNKAYYAIFRAISACLALECYAFFKSGRFPYCFLKQPMLYCK